MRRVATGHREGFSLVEALFALMLLSVVLMSLAPVLFQTVNRQQVDALRLERTGVMVGETNRLLALPFPALDAESKCEDFPGPTPFAHERCVLVTGAGRAREITVVVTPTHAGVGADTMVFTRTRTSGHINPFNTAP